MARLIDANKLESEMYHNTFENKANLQIWDGRCWIRYKMFENVTKEQPTVKAIPVEFIKEYIEYLDAEEKKVLRMMWHTWELLEKKNG